MENAAVADGLEFDARELDDDFGGNIDGSVGDTEFQGAGLRGITIAAAASSQQGSDRADENESRGLHWSDLSCG